MAQDTQTILLGLSVALSSIFSPTKVGCCECSRDGTARNLGGDAEIDYSHTAKRRD